MASILWLIPVLTENSSHFKHVEPQLEQQQRTFQAVADEIKGVKN